MKKKIIVCLCLLMFIMVIGYSALSTSLTITGTGNITTNWNVYFDSITTKEITGGASNAKTPTASGLSATFDYNIEMPGDKIVYELVLKNGGTLDAIVSEVKASNSGTDELIYKIEGIKSGDVLNSGTSKTITITVLFDQNATSLPDIKTSTLTLNLTCVQYGNQMLTGTEPIIVPLKLTHAILNNSPATSDNNIDFSVTSEEDGTLGLYYTNNNTEDNRTTYYFRGAVENNYVKFGKDSSGNDIIWRIIRINEDGSVRIITENPVGSSAFSPNTNVEHAYVGYMYGTTGSSTYEETHANEHDSIIKEFLDGWYTTNLSKYSNLISTEAGFCNDRSLSGGTGTGSSFTKYGAYNRLEILYKPQFACPNASHDLFTMSTSSKGNKKLTKPIGLITADEIAYAGGVYQNNNQSYYLNNGMHMWTMSPSASLRSSASVWYLDSGGSLLNYRAAGESFARPVINLTSNVQITGGNGTKTNPYVIKVN